MKKREILGIQQILGGRLLLIDTTNIFYYLKYVVKIVLLI